MEWGLGTLSGSPMWLTGAQALRLSFAASRDALAGSSILSEVAGTLTWGGLNYCAAMSAPGLRFHKFPPLFTL